jgi:hypothetical protein
MTTYNTVVRLYASIEAETEEQAESRLHDYMNSVGLVPSNCVVVADYDVTDFDKED